MHSLLLGRTLAAERAWDVSRAIDLLVTLPEVRPDRIGCMGNSGGGTVTFYAACVDSRIWLAMPSCSFCTYADSIFRIYHCTEDPIFPIAGVCGAFETARQIYEAAGAPGNLRLVVGDGGHRFYAERAWPEVAVYL